MVHDVEFIPRSVVLDYDDEARRARARPRSSYTVTISIELINQWFNHAVPHNRALGVHVIELIDNGAVAELPHDDRLIGDPARGFLHGGAVTSMIDATCGMAVFAAIKQPQRIATLDLRVDYLRPTSPGSAVRCRAVCYRHTRQIAFVHACAYHEDHDDSPVASAAATFMIFADNMSPGPTGSTR